MRTGRELEKTEKNRGVGVGGGIKAAGRTANAKLIHILEVDAADRCTFSAAAYEIGANWILCREQCD